MEVESSNIKAARESFYQRISHSDLTPLWEVLHNLVIPHPASPCVAAHWSYGQIRPFLDEAGELISAEEAERRVLILENPAMRGQSRLTKTLYGGLQIIFPGETAPGHRHTQSALRFVLEGSGAQTSVEGESISMRPGDLVVTPNWLWHDHRNDSEKPMVWFDCLDIPLINALDVEFAEFSLSGSGPAVRPANYSRTQYGSGLLPAEWTPSSKTSPVFHYPYENTIRALRQLMSSDQSIDPWQGYKLRFSNPVSGDHVTPTLSAYTQLLPEGFVSRSYRCSGGTVFIVFDGEGETQIGDETFSWKQFDTFVVPSWVPHVHKIHREAVLFSYSDRSVLEKLDLWREEKSVQQKVAG